MQRSENRAIENKFLNSNDQNKPQQYQTLPFPVS